MPTASNLMQKAIFGRITDTFLKKLIFIHYSLVK